MFQDSGITREAVLEAIKFYSAKEGIGGGLPILVKALGKKTIKELFIRLLEYIPRFLRKDLIVIIIVRLSKKFPQKVFARAVSGIEIIRIGSDVYFLSKPATRITIPCISLIAAHRTLDRMAEEEVEPGKGLDN